MISQAGKPIVFCEGQRSFGVNRGQIVKTLQTGYFKKGLDRSHIWYRCNTLSTRSLLFLVEVKCHLTLRSTNISNL